MAGAISLELDANGSLIGGGNPGGAYALSSANGWSMLSFADSGSEQDVQWASSADTEGEQAANTRDRNRTVTATFRLAKSTDALLESEFAKLDQKIGKFRKDGGTLKVTFPSTTVGFYDVRRGASSSLDMGHRFTRISRTECQVSLACGPYIRIAEQDLGDNTEATNPVLVFSDTIPGTVDALGRTVVDDDSGNDQWFMVWGVEDDSLYAHTTTSGSGSLWYEAESRTVLGGASVVTGAAGASGGASNNVVRQGTLTSTYQAMLSTQASGGGAHLSHVGVFNVWARIYMPTTNTGAVSVAFEYAQGDFRKKTTVGEVRFDANHSREGQWIFQRLGQITIQKVATGTHRWEGRIIAKSTVAGDDLDIDWVGFWPTKAYGEASAVLSAATPTAFLARDEFDQSAGALAGKTLPAGGTWAGAGDTDDFSVNATSHTADRSAQLDTSPGRFAVAGSTNYSAVVVQVDMKPNDTGIESGVLARYTDTSNYVRATMVVGGSGTQATITVRQNSAGSLSTLGTATVDGVSSTAWQSLRLLVTSTGQWFVWFGPQDRSFTSPLLRGAGISIASGKPGFFDGALQTTSATRSYDNFIAFDPVADAAVFASQSAEIRHDSVLREDSTGTYWNKISSTPGDYLTLPPSGQEGRSTRMIIKLCRNDPDTMSDPAIDDLSARQFATGRFLAMPD